MPPHSVSGEHDLPQLLAPASGHIHGLAIPVEYRALRHYISVGAKLEPVEPTAILILGSIIYSRITPFEPPRPEQQSPSWCGNTNGEKPVPLYATARESDAKSGHMISRRIEPYLHVSEAERPSETNIPATWKRRLKTHTHAAVAAVVLAAKNGRGHGAIIAAYRPCSMVRGPDRIVLAERPRKYDAIDAGTAWLSQVQGIAIALDPRSTSPIVTGREKPKRLTRPRLRSSIMSASPPK